MQIDLVAVPDVDRVWARVVADVLKCLRKVPMEIGAGDIWTNCRSGQWLLIIAHDGETVHGATVWRFTANDLFECVILTGVGLRSWFEPLIEAATAIATSHGCKGLVATGRPELRHPIKKLNPKAKAARMTFHLEF